MINLKAVLVKDPKNLLGKSLRIFLKEGGKFNFYCNEAGENYIAGFDDESLNLRIAIDDIEFVIGS